MTPGSDVYTIGSPLFERASIRLTNGNKFEIISNNVSEDNKYIKAAKLNGKPLDAPFISHEDIMNGGRLEFEMTDRPVKDCFK